MKVVKNQQMNEVKIYKKRFSIFIGSVIALIILIILSQQSGILNNNIFGKKKTFDNLAQTEITASSVYILDVDSGDVIYERNATLVRPLASITKIMTAIVALDLWSKDEIVEATLPFNSSESAPEGYKLLKEKWNLENLLKLMITKSSNEASDALVAYAQLNKLDFIELMNKKAKKIQLWKTKFSNASGLDLTEETPGATGTAEDVAYLMRFALKTVPDIFEPTRLRGYNVKSEAGTDYFVENTNKVANFLPGLIASKTGFTDLAGGNLVYALSMDDSKVVIVAILGSTKDERFRDAEKITQALIADYKSK